MRKLRTLREFLMEQLADPAAAINYLQVTLQEYQIDEDTSFFLREVWTVVEAQGGVSELAKKTNIEPQVLSDVFTSEKALRLDVFSTIMRALGCRLSIEPLKDASSSPDCGDENYSVAPTEGTARNLQVPTKSGNPR